VYSTTQQWKQLGGSTTCPYRKGFVVSLFLAELVFLCIQITVVVAVLWLTFHRASDVDDGTQTTTRFASACEVERDEPRVHWDSLSTRESTGTHSVQSSSVKTWPDIYKEARGKRRNAIWCTQSVVSAVSETRGPQRENLQDRSRTDLLRDLTYHLRQDSLQP
jgi:hypothetical protein